MAPDPNITDPPFDLLAEFSKPKRDSGRPGVWLGRWRYRRGRGKPRAKAVILRSGPPHADAVARANADTQFDAVARAVPQHPLDGIFPLIRHLGQLAQAAAAASDLPIVIETAAGSESTYVHILRNGFWRGIRISAHEAVYACSLDYAQIILPKVPMDPATLGRLENVLRFSVRTGGLVVGDPQVVQRTIRRIEFARTDGLQYQDDAGASWRWNAPECRWYAESVEADAVGFPPIWVPRARLSVGETASLRHRENQREKWAAQIAGASAAETAIATKLFP